MKTEDLKPSVFLSFPWYSIMNKGEAETIARNIMVIRKRRGDTWFLSWAEYVAEREKDGWKGCAEKERGYFDKVYPMIPDAFGAIGFSPEWARAARLAITNDVETENPSAVTVHVDELEALKRDAKRYRWLREQHWNDGIVVVVRNPKENVRLGSDCPSNERLDALVDEATA